MGFKSFFKKIFGREEEQGPFEFKIADLDQTLRVTTYTIEADSREEAFKKLVTNYFGVGPFIDPDIQCERATEDSCTITTTKGMPDWFGEVTKVNGKPEAYDKLNKYLRENNIELY